MPAIPRNQLSPEFISIMNLMLPTYKGYSVPKVDSGLGPRNPGGGGSKNHCGFDINYTNKDGNRDERNNTIPIHSPVNGVVVRAGSGQVNSLDIKDSSGCYHRILHSSTILVKQGQSVSQGQPVSLMGNRTGYGNVHLHYEIRSPDWNIGMSGIAYRISPDDFWSGKKQIYSNIPRQENGLPVEDNLLSDSVTAYDIAASKVPGHNQKEEDPSSGTILGGYAPRTAAIAESSGAVGALLPNRIPQHEPWARNMMVNTEHIDAPTDEINYNTKLYNQLNPNSESGQRLIGRLEGDEEIKRGLFWRR